MKKNVLLLFTFCVCTLSSFSQNIPQVYINTNGQWISDEPKITASMKIMAKDTIMYDSYIGIETRGSSSQGYPKKSYSVETRDAAGNDNVVSLMGFPPETDWVFYAPYSDKSTVRDILTHYLFNRMGRYSPKTHYCEIYLNNEYMGIYVCIEKIKRDKNRVNISKLEPTEISGDNVTGGYILSFDRSSANGFYSSYKFANNSNVYPFYEIRYPKPEDLATEQKTYIKNFIYNFETAMKSASYADPVSGYPKYIDVASFVDYILLTEINKNIDGYRLSTYMHKDVDSKGGKLVAGPPWDYNFAYGWADYGDAKNYKNFYFNADQTYDGLPFSFWWPKLAKETNFAKLMLNRWNELKNKFLHPDSVFTFINNTVNPVRSEIDHNFERWPIIGTYVWANPYVFSSVDNEFTYLKGWYRSRWEWLDVNIQKLVTSVDDNNSLILNFSVSDAYPNPFNPETNIKIKSEIEQTISVKIIDVLGREINTIFNGTIQGNSEKSLSISGNNLSNGIYFISVTGKSGTQLKKIVLMK